jgi:hypothetical protein
VEISGGAPRAAGGFLTKLFGPTVDSHDDVLENVPGREGVTIDVLPEEENKK